MVNLLGSGKEALSLMSGSDLWINGSECQDCACMLFDGTCDVPEVLISNISSKETLFSRSHRISGRHHRRCHRRR